MKQIEEWLGHSDSSTTANIYAHLDCDSKLDSANSMVQGLSLGEMCKEKESTAHANPQAELAANLGLLAANLIAHGVSKEDVGIILAAWAKNDAPMSKEDILSYLQQKNASCHAF